MNKSLYCMIIAGLLILSPTVKANTETLSMQARALATVTSIAKVVGTSIVIGTGLLATGITTYYDPPVGISLGLALAELKFNNGKIFDALKLPAE